MENESLTDNVQESAETWRIYREAARAEYEYAHVSSNRLDNKVYILLAVCAFLFPVLYSVRFETADFMSSWSVYVLTVIRYLPLVCLSAAIVLLLYAVKTIKISRVDVFSAVNEENAYSVSPIDAEIRFTLLYTACTDAGKAEQNRKYAVADIALVFVIVSVFLFIAAVMQREYSEVSKGGEVNMSMNRGAKISEEEAARMTVDEMIDYAVKTRNPLPRTPTTSELMKSKYFTFPGVNRKD